MTTFSTEEALQNMLAAFDSPLTRLKMKDSWTDFHTEAVESARNAINNGNPLYAPETEETTENNKEILASEVDYGQPVIFNTFGETKFILIPTEGKYTPNLFHFIKIGHITNNIIHFYNNPSNVLNLDKNTKLECLIVQ